MLSPDQIRTFYDRFGAKLDTQAFYEEPATRTLADHLELAACRSMLEIGCGTGRFAADLFRTRLAPDTRYLGVDVSGTMVRLARQRLAPFGERADVREADGTQDLACAERAFDRLICTYVLDLLPDEKICALLKNARRVLAPGGLAGFASLTSGPGLFSSLVSSAWNGIHRVSPYIVGGCRPIELLSYIPQSEWDLRFRDVVVSFAIPSEVVVVARRPV